MLIVRDFWFFRVTEFGDGPLGFLFGLFCGFLEELDEVVLSL
jgi:hypothetical protein